MSEIIYLVEGHAGCYDDYHEWIYKAYSSKEKAEETCNRLNSAIDKLKEFYKENSEKLLYLEDSDEILELECEVSGLSEEELIEIQFDEFEPPYFDFYSVDLER